VLLASSGREGLDLLEKYAPDVVLCDIGMPGMDGYEFIRKVRQTGDRTPAVAITAFARSEDRTRALVAGYHGHIAKPVEPGELIATVVAFAKSYSPSRGEG
jgi:CheY-like chemotaxis protein